MDLSFQLGQLRFISKIPIIIVGVSTLIVTFLKLYFPLSNLIIDVLNLLFIFTVFFSLLILSELYLFRNKYNSNLKVGIICILLYLALKFLPLINISSTMTNKIHFFVSIILLILLIYFLKPFYKEIFFPFIIEFLTLFVSNFINISIITIVIILLTIMSQGLDLIINLLSGSIFYCAFFYYLLSVLARSMYNNSFYLNQVLKKDTDIKFEIKDFTWHYEIFGIYRPIRYNRAENPRLNNPQIYSYRKIINIIIASSIYFAWLYALLYSLNIFYSNRIDITNLTIGYFFVFSYFIIVLSVKKRNLFNKMKNDPTISYKKNETFIEYIKLANYYTISLNIFFVIVIVSALALILLGWSKFSIIILIILTVFNSIVFGSRRIFQQEIEYILNNESTSDIKIRFIKSQIQYNQNYLAELKSSFLYRIYNIHLVKANFKGLSNLQSISSIENVILLIIIILLGSSQFLSDILFYYFNSPKLSSSLDLIHNISPLIISFLFIIIPYNHIVYIIKRLAYNLKWNPHNATKNSFPHKNLSLILLIFFGLILTLGESNVMEEVTTVNLKTTKTSNLQDTVSSRIVDFEGYSSSFVNLHGINKDTLTDVFVICAPGGGLRSNLWTLLVLDELNKLSKESILPLTLCMSGVSGGGIGLANYVTLFKNDSLYLNSERSRSAILNIGRLNVLSKQVYYSAFNELLFSLIPVLEYPTWLLGPNRSIKSMKYYDDVLNNKSYEFNELSFYDSWLNAYYIDRISNTHFPALIVSSTSTSKHIGLAHPICGDDQSRLFKNLTSTYDSIVPSYYGIVSTTNRFPILDPPAYVDKRGNYLDGGYFDNSGINSAEYFIENLNLKEFNIRINYIIITSQKSSFISEVFNPFSSFIQNEKNQSTLKTLGVQPNYSAILGAAANTDLIYLYNLERLNKSNSRVFNINLPYLLNDSDIETFFGGELSHDISDYISSNNKEIENALIKDNYDLKLGIVEPGLSRVLSEPSILYTKAMLKHTKVIKELNRINELINEQ